MGLGSGCILDEAVDVEGGRLSAAAALAACPEGQSAVVKAGPWVGAGPVVEWAGSEQSLVKWTGQCGGGSRGCRTRLR